MKPRARIFLLDDHPLMRRGLGQLISGRDDMMVCGEAGDGAAGVAGIGTTRADLAIIDLSLAHSSGLEVIKDVRAQHPRVFILVFTMHDESDWAMRSLRAGAHGYVIKHGPPTDVLDAIHALLRGDRYLSAAIAQAVALAMTGPGRSGDAGAKQPSDREQEVFELLGRGFENGHIAAVLHLSLSTIQSYRERLMEKLGVDNDHQLRAAAVVARVAADRPAGCQLTREQTCPLLRPPPATGQPVPCPPR